MKAAMQGRQDCVAALLLAGADLQAADPIKGKTAREWAAFTGRFETTVRIRSLLQRPQAEQFSTRYRPEWPALAELVAKALSPKSRGKRLSEKIQSMFTFNFPHDPEEDGVLDHMVRMTTSLASPFVATACQTVCPDSPPEVGKHRLSVPEILGQHMLDPDAKPEPTSCPGTGAYSCNGQPVSEIRLLPRHRPASGLLRFLPLWLRRGNSIFPGEPVPKIKVSKATCPPAHSRERRQRGGNKDLLQPPKWRKMPCGACGRAVLVLLTLSLGFAADELLCACDVPHCSLPTCTGKVCFVSKRKEEGIITQHRGCFSQNILENCRTPVTEQYGMKCCHSSMCNAELEIFLQGEEALGKAPSLPSLLLMIFIPLFALLVLVALTALFCWKVAQHRYKKSDLGDMDLMMKASMVGDSTLEDLLNDDCTTGSGSGLPFLVQRTVARQITLVECVGKESGCVGGEAAPAPPAGAWACAGPLSPGSQGWHRNARPGRGTPGMRYPGDAVPQGCGTPGMHCPRDAAPRDAAPRGCVTPGMQYPRDAVPQGCGTPGMWYPRDALPQGCSTPGMRYPRDALPQGRSTGMALTRAGIPPGLAVMHSQGSDYLDIGNNPRVGTKRYMAPEVLSEQIRTDCFESYKKTDIWAYGLVLWEITRRTVVNGIVEEYRPPFFDAVPSDPSFEDMKKVVCIDQQTPVVPNRLFSDSV
ncbi:ACVL1 kinase, partial [Anhinga rufa]|nr:ACVL1 kinase [Anhinga rufa]